VVVLLFISSLSLARIFQAPEAFIGKAFKGEAVASLPQTVDNAANECLRERPTGEIFYACQQKAQVTNCTLSITIRNLINRLKFSRFLYFAGKIS
jgi:hypothetical protein